MLLKKATHPTRELRIVPPATDIADHNEEVSKAEIRRQMYERIARGHALAEAEDHARRVRHGR